MAVETQHEVEFAQPKRRRKGRHLIVVSLLLVLVYALVSYSLSLPSTKPTLQAIAALPAQHTEIVWPSYGQAALGAPGYEVLASHDDTTPVPTASIAKVLTALAIMKQYPLLKGQQGPTITVTANDVADYQNYLAVQGSVIQVEVGEQLTEYQALQAMLLPSANNIADLLAGWAFGSTANYVHFANLFVKSLGLNQTTVADASGFSPQTTSTAHDLVLLGENVMDNPVLADIVGQPQATIPVVGTIYNVNLLVGHQEIIGIKTGNTDEAGGCFMVAARHPIDSSHSIVVIAVTLGAPDLSSAITSITPLLQSAYQNFGMATVVRQGATVGNYKPAWGLPVAVTASQNIQGVIWRPTPPIAQVNLEALSSKQNNALSAGSISVLFGRQTVSVPVTVASLPSASPLWRFTHPLRQI